MRFRFTLSNDIKGDLELPRNPGGWKEMSTLFTRSPKYHGIFYQQTINLQFFCGSGKEYIDSVISDLGIDAKVTLLIESACNYSSEETGSDYNEDYNDDYGGGAIDDCDFETEFTGKLSLKTWSTINGRDTVDIIQENITDTVINRLDTVIDLTKLETLDGTALPSLDYAPYEMDLHSKAILLKSRVSASGGTITESQGLTIATSESLSVSIPYATEYEELNSLIPFSLLVIEGPLTSTNFPNGTIIATEAGIHTINYDFEGTLEDALARGRTYSLTLAYYVRNSAAIALSVINPYGIHSPVAGAASYPFSETGTLSLSLSVGDIVGFYFELANYFPAGTPNTDPTTITINLTGGGIDIEKVSKTSATKSKVFAINEACTIVANSISDQTDGFRSTLYGRKNSQPFAYENNGCASFRAVTNGALIRGFPISDQSGVVIQAGRPVRTTMNEIFDTCNAIDNIGMGIIDNKIVFEKKSFFYSDTLLFRLSNVPDMKISVAPEYYYSKVNAGYAKWQIEQKGGLDEVNSTRQYDLGLKTIDNTLTIISPMIAGPYPLEVARRKQYSASFTEDAETDNDNFIICLNKSVDGNGVPNNLTTAEKDENYSQVNNVLDAPSEYNLEISPGRNVLRWSPVLNAGLLKYPARKFKFTSGEGNFKMTSQSIDACSGGWNNELFSEGDDIQHDDVNNSDNIPLWDPFINIFRFPLNKTQSDLLKNNPYGYIEVSATESDYEKWFIVEAKINLVGGMTDFKLLRKWES